MGGPLEPSPTVRRHGHQKGVVAVGQSKRRIQRPRLRTVPDAAAKSVEVEPPAYAALKKDPQLARRILGVALGGGVSRRKYHKILDQTAQRVGISKSAVSRGSMAATFDLSRALGVRRGQGV